MVRHAIEPVQRAGPPGTRFHDAYAGDLRRAAILVGDKFVVVQPGGEVGDPVDAIHHVGDGGCCRRNGWPAVGIASLRQPQALDELAGGVRLVVGVLDEGRRAVDLAVVLLVALRHPEVVVREFDLVQGRPALGRVVAGDRFDHAPDLVLAMDPLDRVVDAVAKLGHGVVGQSAEIVVGILVDRLVLVHHLGPLTLTIIPVLHPVVKAVDAAIRPKERAGAFDLAERANALEWSQRTEGTGGASGTRGRDGSLALSRTALSSATPCRS